MTIHIIEVKTQKEVKAKIEKAVMKDMPMKKDDWQFNWKSLFKTEGAEFYKLTTDEDPYTIQGMIMFSLMNDEMLYMNNIEIAPHNFGSKGKFDKVAACLIAFGCLKSFELGQNDYKGYATFESKTKLIPLYQQKYGATLAMGQRMFIEPKVGLQLIEEYLKLKL